MGQMHLYGSQIQLEATSENLEDWQSITLYEENK